MWRAASTLVAQPHPTPSAQDVAPSDAWTPIPTDHVLDPVQIDPDVRGPGSSRCSSRTLPCRRLWKGKVRDRDTVLEQLAAYAAEPLSFEAVDVPSTWPSYGTKRNQARCGQRRGRRASCERTRSGACGAGVISNPI